VVDSVEGHRGSWLWAIVWLVIGGVGRRSSGETNDSSN
jgi:hypothetical protein